MKKFLVLLISILVFIMTPAVNLFASAASLADPAVIIFTEKHETDEIYITARLQTNTGISDAKFTLEYDNTALQFLGYSRGSGLSSLEFMTTNVDNDLGYDIYPFVFHYYTTGNKVGNDDTVGNLVTLHFSVRENAKSGNYTVGFDSEISFLDADGFATLKKVLCGSAKFHIGGDGISDVVIGEPDEELKNTIAIILISVIAVVLIVGVIVALVFARRGKKNVKDKWVKL